MKRKLQDLLPLLTEARQLHLKALFNASDNLQFIYENGKYYMYDGYKYERSASDIKFLCVQYLGMRSKDISLK